ncbi:MAG: hypothetical protein WAT58_04400 [Candidatus Dormiibacterota bacterium]
MRLPRLSVQRLLMLVLVGTLFVMASGPLIDTDLWWHLANGRYILANGVPATDVYSYTAVGHLWVVHEWLSDVLFYLLYQPAGLRGLTLMAGAVIAATGWLIYRLLRRGGLGNNSAVVLALLLALATSPSWGARPQILNFLFTAILVETLLRYRERPGRWIFLLVPFFLLWANLHSGYLVGVGLLAVYLVGETLQARWRAAALSRAENLPVLTRPDLVRVALTGVLGLCTGFLTPGTYRTVLFPLGTLSSSRIQTLIVEWSSPDFHVTAGGLPNVAGISLMVVLLVLVAGAIGAVRFRRGADPTVVLWALVSLVMALTSQRHVPIFAVAGAPLVGVAASTLLAGLGARARPERNPTQAMVVANTLIAAVLLVGAGLFVAGRSSDAALDKAVAAAEPVAATDYLLANHLPGRVFNSYEYGGWLIWKAYPAYPVFIDGRTEVYGDEVFDQYIRTKFLSDQWRQSLNDYQVRTVMIPSGDPLRLVLEGDGWKLAYSDTGTRVYTR